MEIKNQEGLPEEVVVEISGFREALLHSSHSRKTTIDVQLDFSPHMFDVKLGKSLKRQTLYVQEQTPLQLRSTNTSMLHEGEADRDYGYTTWGPQYPYNELRMATLRIPLSSDVSSDTLVQGDDLTFEV